MSAGGVHRSASPSPAPSPSLSPCLSLQPMACQSQRRFSHKDASIPVPNGSVSPSAESLKSSSLLQIPPPPPARPRSSSSSLSLQQNTHSSQSSVHIPHLPPPPRPLSSPSLSTLVTVQPWLSSPQLSSKIVATPRRQQQQEQEKQEQQQILRKYSDNSRYAVTPAATANALRVDNNVRKSSGVVTSVVDRDYHFRSMDADMENPHDTARVKFLQTERREKKGQFLPLTSRERNLACIICILFVACVAFIIVAFNRDAHYRAQTQTYCLSATCVSTAAQLMAAMDVTADPCEDFFRYACGQWNKLNAIPEDKHSYNTFEKMYDKLQIILRQLLEEQAGRHDCNATLKAKTMYRSCMNMTQINYIGGTPLRSITERLGGWPIILEDWGESTSFSLEKVLAIILREYNEEILIGCTVAPDDKNSSTNIIRLDQPTLGMPDREYYLNANLESEYLQAYLSFMRGVVQLMGASEDAVEDQLLDLLELETKLANVSRPRAERHDTGALYRKMTIATLQQLVPQLNWMNYLQQALNLTLTSNEQVVVFAVEYFYDMMNIVKETDSRTMANYVIWRVVMELAPELSESYQQVNSKYRMVMRGVKRDTVRWKKCVENVNINMGLAVGAMYVRDNFRRQSKETAMEMIQDIRNAFNELLTENEWMDEATKKVAKQKANAMKASIGYPDYITNPAMLDAKFEELSVKEGHYFQNVLAIKRFAAEQKMSQLRRPVMKDVWEHTPAEVNAYYSPNNNYIVFPAAILQPLFYSEHFPKSLNYGGIGVVIGHEITHGFDDKGRQYDINGNLAQWWDNATIDAFRQRAQCMIDQYSSYKLEQTGHYIDGKYTQGENIADNGGLKQAYRAYQIWVEKHGPEPPLPGIGLTHDQLFFLNYAQIWCGNIRDEEALLSMRTSEHSPGPIRILGPLSNSLDFSRVYKCPKGSRMNPHHKCSVW